MTFRPMPLLTVLSLISLVILILLGNWQYGRYAQKIENPTVTEQVQSSEQINIEIDTSHPGNAQQVYGFADSEPIWRRYVPGRVAGSEEPVLIMIEATGGPNAVPARVADFPDALSIDGTLSVKRESQSAFGSRGRVDKDTWYTFKPDQMAERLGLDATPRFVEPVIMTVRNAADLSQSRQTLNPYAFAAPIDPLPPERHFGYALTWWGMALGLIGVYVALHRLQGRLKF
mgnify:CR=1 FL=1